VARKQLIQDTCDRCGKMYNEAPPAPVTNETPKNAAARPPMLMLQVVPMSLEGGKEQPLTTIKFDDLCPKCQSRCLDLVAAIRLEKTDVVVVEAEKIAAAPEKPADKPLDEGKKSSDNKTNDAKASAKA
jgi:hypothetical protein